MKFTIALLIGILWFTPGRAVMDEGDPAWLRLACKDREAIFAIATGDEISVKAAEFAINKMIKVERCGVLSRPVLIKVGRLLHVYTDHAGIISEIREVMGGSMTWYAIFMDPKEAKKNRTPSRAMSI